MFYLLLRAQISNLHSTFICISLTIRLGLLQTLLEGLLLFGVHLCLVWDVSPYINMQEPPEEIMTIIIIILRDRYKPDSIECFIYKIILFNSHCKSELGLIIPILEMRKVKLRKIRYFIYLSGRPRF